jgi:hypothetical protein
MNTRLIRAALTVVLAALPARAALADTFDLNWWTVDGGGDMNTVGGTFTLSGTIGQPDAGPAMTGGGFSLTGGFWLAATPTCLGDCNCDGQIDFDDINAFVAALGAPEAACFFPNIDIDGNGQINFDDINPFVAILSSSGGPCQ